MPDTEGPILRIVADERGRVVVYPEEVGRRGDDLEIGWQDLRHHVRTIEREHVRRIATAVEGIEEPAVGEAVLTVRGGTVELGVCRRVDLRRIQNDADPRVRDVLAQDRRCLAMRQEQPVRRVDGVSEAGAPGRMLTGPVAEEGAAPGLV